MNRVRFAAAVAAVALASTPALAVDFSGSRIEARLGWTDVSTNGLNDDGVAYGVAIGHDFAIGQNVVIGGEVAFDMTDAKKCAVIGGIEGCAKAKRDLSVAARLGYKVADDALLYAKAGYANGRLRITADDGTVAGGLSFDGDGVVLGTGLEYIFAGNAFAKVEYSYTNYEMDFERHQIITGVGIRF